MSAKGARSTTECVKGRGRNDWLLWDGTMGEQRDVDIVDVDKVFSSALASVDCDMVGVEVEKVSSSVVSFLDSDTGGVDRMEDNPESDRSMIGGVPHAEFLFRFPFTGRFICRDLALLPCKKEMKIT